VARSVQRRGLVLAGDRSEHDDDDDNEVYRVSRPEHSEERCGHRLVSVVPIVSMRAIVTASDSGIGQEAAKSGRPSPSTLPHFRPPQ
jgi:hypothetical protein